MATNKQIDMAMAALDAAYPQHFKQLSDEQVTIARRLYHRILADIDGALIEAAVLHWLSTARPFHPSPGELRDMAYSLSSHQNSAEEAWGQVKRAISQYGVYRIPQFDDSLVADAANVIGWRELCLSENEVANRAHFFKVYDALKARKRNDDLMLPEVRRSVDQLQAGRVRGLLGTLAEKMRR